MTMVRGCVLTIADTDAYQNQHDQGKTNVRGVEADINKH